MDMKPANRAEIKQFLMDVRAHFRASLETSEYENASNLFHVTDAAQTVKLLARCELLLARYADEQAANAIDINIDIAAAVVAAAASAPSIKSNGFGDCVDSRPEAAMAAATAAVADSANGETGCYLEMLSSTASTSKNSLSASREYIDFASNTSVDSDKTFRCSSSQQSTAPVDNDRLKDQQLYDICQSLADDETQKAIAPDSDLSLAVDCPYRELPAGHLAIQRSTKYGQLQRIEKRLFFDQSKKCYCGILNDWMLCYADGPTACRPTSTLYLKSSAIEIEHSGEGKRREICFQITTADPNKKFVYQASNEVDAKEWIHAIEAAIRGDAANSNSAAAAAGIAVNTTPALKMARKLPTPPVMKKSSYTACSVVDTADCIYEEPSPIYNCSEPVTPPRLPEKSNSPSALAKRFEYDIPKYPAQPLAAKAEAETASGEIETAGLLMGVGHSVELKPQSSSLHDSLKLDFKSKVRNVHNELSSQLAAGGSSPERLKPAVKKTYSCSSSEGEAVSLTNSPTTPTLKEQAKQRKPPATVQAAAQKAGTKDCDKLARNWFLSRLNKTAGLGGSRSAAGACTAASAPANARCKQSEKENLLTGLDMCDGYDVPQNDSQLNHNGGGSSPTSPCLKADAKSKVNMIINQFESSGHLSTMFSVEALAANAIASLTSFCESDNCNNYEPIMPVSTPPSSFLKKV